MPPASQATLDALGSMLARARRWELWVIDFLPTGRWPDVGAMPTEAFASCVLAHLGWLENLEQAGTLVMSGPLDEAISPGGGMSVVRAANREVAFAIAAGDPMVAAGYRTSRVRSWTVNEGSMHIRVNLFGDQILI